MATLSVGPGRQFATIAAALAAARAGDTVAVAAGTYVNDFGTIRARVSLVAVGGQVTLLATRPLATNGALLTVSADAVIDGFVFANAAAADGTAAGLLYTAGALVVRNSLFVGNQTGLLGLGDAAGTIVVQGSEFDRNGAGDGFTHNLAVGAVRSLTVQDSYVHDAAGGAEVRSRAKATTITNTRIQDNAGASTVSLDLPNGGVVVVQGSTIEKGAAAGAVVIREGGDTAYAGSSLRVTGSVIVADRPGAVLLQNLTTATATLSGDTLYGFSGTGAITGPAAVSALVVAGARPEVVVTPLVAPAFALPVEFGRAGAVVATGVVRMVGPGGAYATLAAAVAAAQDGDTIRVAAGTYRDDSAVIDKRLVIEGVGGVARFVATRPPANGLAQFVTTADVTFRGIEVSGVAIPGGVGAAILDRGGRLTLVDSVIHDNQAGLVATGGASIGIYDSEFVRNGTPDGRGGNIDVGAVGTLTVRGGWVHDGLAAAEIRSRADNTVLEGTRVSQTRGDGAAGLELPEGGRVTVGNSVFEKGANSQATALIHVGGAKAGSSVGVTGTTLINPVAASFVVADAGSASVSVSGGAQLRAAGGAAPAAERGVLALRISGDAYRGDARFTVTVDGAQVGGTLAAAASHAAGQTQTFVIAGQFAPGPHSVTVRFVNDLNGADGVGRALYVDGASLNGEAFGRPAALASNGAVTLSTGPTTRPTNVVLGLSETAVADAHAFIAIDGTVLGGMQSVSGVGTMRFLLDLAPGPHVATVTAVEGDGRLSVDWLEVAGQRYAAGTEPVRGAASFAFTVGAPAAANSELFLTAGLPEMVVPV